MKLLTTLTRLLQHNFNFHKILQSTRKQQPYKERQAWLESNEERKIGPIGGAGEDESFWRLDSLRRVFSATPKVFSAAGLKVRRRGRRWE